MEGDGLHQTPTIWTLNDYKFALEVRHATISHRLAKRSTIFHMMVDFQRYFFYQFFSHQDFTLEKSRRWVCEDRQIGEEVPKQCSCSVFLFQNGLEAPQISLRHEASYDP